MCILTLNFNTPIVPIAVGKSYSITRGNNYWTSRCNVRYEKVEYRKAVWLQMAEFVLTHPGCSSQEIRTYMGWGLNADRGHCDYFSTMIDAGKLIREGRKYYLSNSFANKVAGYLDGIDACLADLNVPANCQRMTEEEYVIAQDLKEKAKIKREERRKIKLEAYHG